MTCVMQQFFVFIWTASCKILASTKINLIKNKRWLKVRAHFCCMQFLKKERPRRILSSIISDQTYRFIAFACECENMLRRERSMFKVDTDSWNLLLGRESTCTQKCIIIRTVILHCDVPKTCGSNLSQFGFGIAAIQLNSLRFII